MAAPDYLEKLTPRTRRALAMIVLLGLAVLAVTVFTSWLFVRALVRQQIAQRDARALYDTTLMEQLDARSANGDLTLESDEQIGFDAAILASRLRGVIGIRFFDREGEFTDSFPATIQPMPLATEALEAVRRFQPHSEFRAETPLSEVFIYLPQFATGQVARVPTLEVTVPLHRREGGKLAGAAEFILEGQGIAEEYQRLDRHLGSLAGLAFVAAGLLLALLLWPAFRHIERLNRQLAQRSEHLSRANQELALAARASALGAVSAHLMHGLKNPLASLSQFVNSGRAGGQDMVDEDWQDALAAARRMQTLVDQTLEVLRDARSEPTYSITAQELAASLRSRVGPLARQRRVELAIEVAAAATFSSRVCNLISLILTNLLENALQATAENRRVTFSMAAEEGLWVWRVRDQGPGFPAHLRDNLFLPCKSTREGGSGIGLAICKQLADHLGAKLDLAESSTNGCLFILRLPQSQEALVAQTDAKGSIT